MVRYNGKVIFTVDTMTNVNKNSIDAGKYPTPYYNSLILQDMVMDENYFLLKEIIDVNQNVQDALVLLKIWLTQKNLGVSSMLFLFNNVSVLYFFFVKT